MVEESMGWIQQLEGPRGVRYKVGYLYLDPKLGAMPLETFWAHYWRTEIGSRWDRDRCRCQVGSS
jgi:hypothetical protein